MKNTSVTTGAGSGIPYHTFTELLSMMDGLQHTEGLFIVTEEDDNRMRNLVQYPFRSDHFIIIMQVEGTSQVRINSTDFHIREKEILLIPPNAVRQFQEVQTGMRFAGLVFTSGFVARSGISKKDADMLDFFSASLPGFELKPAEFDRLLNMLMLLREKYTSTDGMPADQQVIFYLFLAFLYELRSVYMRNNGDKKIQLTRKEEITMRFIRLLNDYCKEERSVLFYAAQMNVTPRHLTQTVKEVTGRSAGELIDEMVIVEAKLLLNDVSLSLAQVAEKLYFSDQFFFSKFFKRNTGITPSEYRKFA
ncbi:helix-turn-helix domain-containing protein [Chitinophaga filiformis]|uniref:Helix-turn-helix domain-containing protein n=1 Tax=Chitinophaga filiformis TaxID=104663 RepID=A0ABY4HTT9_CHIFI|nr:helix-turn-helix domain-containing protein [Chitinophaga filiformis]UPK67007.1 helix-turn-helix domain-containing protein [Chitinophaga filiformis]